MCWAVSPPRERSRGLKPGAGTSSRCISATATPAAAPPELIYAEGSCLRGVYRGSFPGLRRRSPARRRKRDATTRGFDWKNDNGDCTQVTHTCDVCGTAEDVRTWTFRLDGKTYETDLCPIDGEDLNEVAAGYIAKARKVTGGQGRRQAAKVSRAARSSLSVGGTPAVS